jgi:hypothetical protein
MTKEILKLSTLSGSALTFQYTIKPDAPMMYKTNKQRNQNLCFGFVVVLFLGSVALLFKLKHSILD